MKTKVIILLIAALSGLTVDSSLAAPATAAARMHRVSEVLLRGHPQIVAGESRNSVRAAVGSGHKKLTPNLWLYHRYEIAGIHPAPDDCSELLVHFEHGRVASIHLANSRACELIIARIKGGASELAALQTESKTPVTAPIAATR